jgi:hypothetical protein
MAMRRWFTDGRLARALPWIVGVVAAGIALRNLWSFYGDLGIYLDAAAELRRGGVDLYRDRSPHGALAYPHAFLVPLLLLQELFGGATVTAGDAAPPLILHPQLRVLWSLGLGVAAAMIARDLIAAMRAFGGLRWWQWLAFGCLFQRCIAQNLTHGQLSLWTGACLLRGVVRVGEGRQLRGGLWLGAAAALKLTPLLFVVALPFARRPAAAVTALLSALALALLLPWPFLGTSEHLRVLGDFWRAVIAPLLDGSRLAVLRFHEGCNVDGTLDYLLQANAVDRDGLRVNLVDLSPGALRAVKLAWSLLLALLLAATWRRAQSHREPARWLLRGALVMLAIAFFSPMTRVYHLAGCLLPAALFCRGPGRRDWLWWLAAAGFALTMTLRQRNLIGERLWSAFDHAGLLHASLVLLSVWLWRRASGPPVPSTPPGCCSASG